MTEAAAGRSSRIAGPEISVAMSLRFAFQVSIRPFRGHESQRTTPQLPVDPTLLKRPAILWRLRVAELDACASRERVVSRSDRSSEAASQEGAVPVEPGDRPGASGHRFGPDLACSECGIHWDAHQRQPAPCVKDEPGDVFLRRPAVDEPAARGTAATPPSASAAAPEASSSSSAPSQAASTDASDTSGPKDC